MEEALAAMSVHNDVRAALWQIANKSWKPKSNPFGAGVGQKVYDALNGG